MRLIEGSGERGPIVSSAIVVASLGVLMFAVFTRLPLLDVAPVIAASAIAAVAYRTLLAWRAVLTALLLIILFIPIRRYTMPGNLPFELEPYRLFVAFAIVGWVGALLVDPRIRIRASGLERPLFVIALGTLASLVVNAGRVHSVEPEVVKKLTFFASFFLVFYLIVSVIRSATEVDALVKVLVAGGAVVAALTLIEARTHYNVFNHLSGVIPLLQLTELPYEDQFGRGARLRVYASAQHPIALSAVFMMLLPLALYLGRRFAQKRWWIAAGVLVVASLGTVSRTSVLMLLAVIGVFLWLRGKETRRLWPAVIPVLIVIHIALPGALGSLKDAFLPPGGLIAEQAAGAGTTGSGRIADLSPSLAEFAHKPILGQGFGTRVVDLGRQNALILDNQWLGTLLETGAVGALAWGWLFFRFVRRAGREAKADPSQRGWLLAAIAASVTAYAVGMIAYDAFAFIQVTFLLFILLGLGVAVLTPRSRRRGRLSAAGEP